MTIGFHKSITSLRASNLSAEAQSAKVEAKRGNLLSKIRLPRRSRLCRELPRNNGVYSRQPQ